MRKNKKKNSLKWPNIKPTNTGMMISGNRFLKEDIEKQSGHPTMLSRSPEPTAMECAFREAESRKEQIIPITKTVEGHRCSVPEKIETTKPDPFREATLRSNTVTLVPYKVKNVMAPLTGTQSKNTIVAQPQSQDKGKVLNAASAVLRNTSPVKLEVKPVPDKSLVLEDLRVYQVNQKPSQKSSRNEIPETVRTQLHDGSYNDERDIVIGFDFGTSSSKVVIRDSGLRKAYGVTFVPFACSENSYLIPTKIYVNDDGGLSLQAGKYPCVNIKSRLMDNPEQVVFSTTNLSISVSEIAAGYIAMVIRFARDWFLKHTESIYKKTDIHWHINLGIPSSKYDDSGKQRTFQTIAMAAWKISLYNSTLNVAEVKIVFQEARGGIKRLETEELKSLWIHPDFVRAHPEVIMEVVGYARSPLRTNGLHLIVDVGATTMDVAMFIIHNKEGEDVFPLLETNVEKLGTMMLHKRRMQTLETSMQHFLQQIDSVDPISPLPSLSHYAIKVNHTELSENDNDFFNQCAHNIGEVIRITKRRRDPYSGIWEKELPVFICGGGGRLLAYRKMINELGSRIADSWNDFKGFAIKEIPKPEQLDAPDLSPNEYDRLAVAYGLSFTSDEIGELIPKSKLSDITKDKSVLNIEDRYVSKDMC